MPDIFDEVQEELRAERARKLGMRYGGMAAGLALLALLGIGGWQGWQWYQQREADRLATTFLELNRATEAEGADLRAMGERFGALAAESPTGYRVLARLRAAALKAETGDRAAALAIWDELAADASAPQLYRDLGSLMWVLHGLDSQDPAALASRIQPLAATGQAWSASAREMQGLIALRRGDRDEAKRILETLAGDVTAPRGVRERAERLAAGMGV
ncbi:tetratricopeptide repeat protein [Pseudoroseomonas globiformis]|uniref:Tetratricopeptide repeat protein n=1 Tax=Teichococcus globiformis TaxID=2307229 RepID=A0ABV7G5N2_9PROT